MELDARCPYCGEPVSLWIDDDPAAVGAQRYVEDCAICCRPCEVHAWRDEDGELRATLARLDA